MTRSGCYKIVNHATGKFYIGSAVNLKRRLSRHLTDLRYGRHDNQHLQRAFDKDGEDAFTFEVVAYCEPGSLLDWEQAFIDACEPEYNILRTAGSAYGRKHTPETRAKMSASRQGHAQPEEVRAKISASSKGVKRGPFTEEHRAKIGAANRERVFTPEMRANISAGQIGKRMPPFSEEHKAKLSAAAKEREARKRKGLGG